MKNWIIIGAFLAIIAVILGAFGAHILKSKLPPEDLAIFETGVRYHMYHALAIIILGVVGLIYDENLIRLPAILLVLGIFVFSGSLYSLVLTGYRWLGAITPIICPSPQAKGAEESSISLSVMWHLPFGARRFPSVKSSVKRP